jgi:uncharacterized protein YlxW (UPF0749 family)
MQNRTVLAALLAIALSPLCFAQSGGKDANTQAAILAELRSIHEDLRAAQAMQALLVEWQMEQGMVNRATDRVEEARSKLIEIQTNLKVATAHVSEVEERSNESTKPDEQVQLKAEVERAQAGVATLKAEVQARSSALDDLQRKLRNAEDDLANTQDELNASIQKTSKAPSSPPSR